MCKGCPGEPYGEAPLATGCPPASLGGGGGGGGKFSLLALPGPPSGESLCIPGGAGGGCDGRGLLIFSLDFEDDIRCLDGECAGEL